MPIAHCLAEELITYRTQPPIDGQTVTITCSPDVFQAYLRLLGPDGCHQLAEISYEAQQLRLPLEDQ